jgi:hypothetical protein
VSLIFKSISTIVLFGIVECILFISFTDFKTKLLVQHF